jgi:inosine triphosphate pyrophosphatase
MKKTIVVYFVTGNADKAREFEEITKSIASPDDDREIVVKTVDIDITEIQGTKEEVVTEKIGAALSKLQYRVDGEYYLIVEDVGFSIAALGGNPGPYIKDFLRTVPLGDFERIVSGFEDKSAVATCIYAVHHVVYNDLGDHGFSEWKPVLCEGIAEGTIVAPRGKGWGFDPIFEDKVSKKTWGEMNTQEKNAVSHRRRALVKLADYFNTL